jgi:hypothetical protein
MFGICQVCSSNSGDTPRASLGSADAGYAITSDGSNTDVRIVANDYLIDEKREGVPLEWYQGKKVCRTCKLRLSSDAESLLSAKRHARQDRRRAGMGFGGIT